MTMPRSLIREIHEYLRSSRFGSKRNERAPRGLHKEYPRMQKVVLPKPDELSMTLGEALEKRSSTHPERNKLSVQEISTLLFHSVGMRTDGLRKYPSGGALYPIETYLLAFRVEGLSRSVFHYHPSTHTLEYLWDVPEDLDIKNILLHQEKEPRALLVFSGVWRRSADKYGDFGYYLGLLETGHMAQNVLLASAALGISATPLGGGFFERVLSELLDLSSTQEQPVYAISYW